MFQRIKTKKGVTLIELAIVFAIIGMMASVAVVSLSSSKANTRLKAAMAEVSSTIRTAQSYALQGKTPSGETVCGYGFRFKDDKNYEIFYVRLNELSFADCGSQNSDANYRQYIDSSASPYFPGQFFALPDNVVLTNSDPELNAALFFDMPHANIYDGQGISLSSSKFLSFESPPESGNIKTIEITKQGLIIEDSPEAPSGGSSGSNCPDGTCNGLENCSTCSLDCSCGSGICYNDSCCDPITSCGSFCGTALDNGCGGMLNCPACADSESCSDSYTKLLLHMDDTGLTDSSASAHAVTKNGDVARSATQSKFGGYSGYLDGAGDYLEISDSNDWELTGDFTIDFWFNPSDAGDQYLAAGKINGGNDNSWAIDRVNNTRMDMNFGGVAANYLTVSIATGNWYHFAAVRSGSVVRFYVNGSEIGNLSNPNTIGASTDHVRIGAYSSSAAMFNGYIDEVRISKGIARWTSNFTPPTSAYSSTSCSADEGNDSYTKLLLHMDDTGLTDSSASAHAVTKNGDVARSATQSKFGGYSGYLDGAGDYLSILENDDWYFGSGDFTVDFWFMTTSPSTHQYIATSGGLGSSNQNGWDILYHNTEGIRFDFYDGTGHNVLHEAWTPTASVWYHIAVVRNGSSFKAYVDGSEIGDGGSDSAAIPDSNLPLYIGRECCGTGYSISGYVDEFRISKGIARWTGNFTPSTSAY